MEENHSGTLFAHVVPRGGVWVRWTCRVNWTAVKNLVLAAYFMTAPSKLREQLKEGTPHKVGNHGRRRLTTKRSVRRTRGG